MTKPTLAMILLIVASATLAAAQPVAEPTTQPTAPPANPPTASQPTTELPPEPTGELPAAPATAPATAQPTAPPTAQPTPQPAASPTAPPAVLTTTAVYTISPQDAFFGKIRALCGLSFEGKVIDGNASDAAFTNKRLVMNVRTCTESVIEISFQAGDDRSRTWVLTRTGSGIQFKHIHRHQDGSEDATSNYGGQTVETGWPSAQSFPADPYTKDLFVARGIPQSVGNTWHLYIYPEKFSYHLTREGREFRIDFDLTRPVPTPPAPWGAK